MNELTSESKTQPVFRSPTIGLCANCKIERAGRLYEIVAGKRTLIRYEGYIGYVYDSFETKKVFLCDDCVGKQYRRWSISNMVLYALITLTVVGLLIWPALNNFSGGHWSTGIVFIGLALLPILAFILWYFSDFRKRMEYITGNPDVKLTGNQLEGMTRIASALAEKLALDITRKEVASDPVLNEKGINLFLTPKDYQILLKKSSPDLPAKK